LKKFFVCKLCLLLIVGFSVIAMSAPSFAESMDDLVERGGLYYKKFTDTPFTGRVTVDQSRFSLLHYQGSLVDGKKEGLWITYKSDGRLFTKTSYKNGKQEGLFEFFWSDGRPRAKGHFRNGNFEGSWVFYEEDGSIDKTMTGIYKNDLKVSD